MRLTLSNHLNQDLYKLKKSGIIFPHPIGIVIGKGVKIGNNCTIYQNVTIGTKEITSWENAPYPSIGNNVTICANSILFGDISIGDNCLIGAGSVVFKSFPANCIIAGNPAKIINYIDDQKTT